MTNHQLINQSSGDVEIYTPQFIIEAARETMGGIDLDPASSYAANKRVKSEVIFTEKEDGLSMTWFGNVWMNHPFSRKGNADWIKKLMQAYALGHAKQACCICFASTSEKWFQPLFDYPMCFLSPRTNYLRPDGTVYRGAPKGSVVTYLGPDLESFRKNFSPLGKIKV